MDWKRYSAERIIGGLCMIESEGGPKTSRYLTPAEHTALRNRSSVVGSRNVMDWGDQAERLKSLGQENVRLKTRDRSLKEAGYGWGFLKMSAIKAWSAPYAPVKGWTICQPFWLKEFP